MNFKANYNHKYGAKKSTYNGYSYDSCMEAKYAMLLDLRKKAGEIKSITKQKKLELFAFGSHITNYYIDFVVELHNGEIELHEVKGFKTPEWILKKKLTEAQLEDLGKRYFNGITPTYKIIEVVR